MSSEIEIVKNLSVPSGTNKRMDCPFCYHRNTFSVRNENGKLLWNCFHSSCNIKGGEQTEYSMEDIENYLGIPIDMISNGPGRDENIIIKKIF